MNNALLILLMFCFLQLQSQVYQDWEITFPNNTNGQLRIYDSEEHDDGFYFAGSYATDGFWIIKSDHDGLIEWEQVILSGWANDLIATDDGGLLAVGNNTEPYESIDSWDYVVLKLDSLGNLEWKKFYGSALDEAPEGGIEEVEGGYIIGGRNGVATLDTHPYFVKIDTLGEVIWESTFEMNQLDGIQDLKATPDGGCIAVGWTIENLQTYDEDIYIVKLSATGEVEWQKSFGGNMHDRAWEVTVIDGQSYGIINSVTLESKDERMNLLKLDNEGNIVWEKNYGESIFEAGSSIVHTRDRGFILAGVTAANDMDTLDNITQLDWWIVKTDSLGIVDWEMTLGGDEQDQIYSIKETQDGYILCGQTFWDAWVVKLKFETSNNGFVEYQTINEDCEVYPNPTIETVNIGGRENMKEILLYDIQGNLLMRNPPQDEIDLSKIQPGNYVLKIIGSGNQSKTCRIIKH